MTKVRDIDRHDPLLLPRRLSARDCGSAWTHRSPRDIIDFDLEIGKSRALTSTTADIAQLRDAVRAALGGSVLGPPTEPEADWRQAWPALADLGITAFCVPESLGGFGFRIDAAVATAIEFGGALHPAPIAAITAATYALAQADDSAPEVVDLLADVVAGVRICSFGRFDRSTAVASMVDRVADSDALVLISPDAGELILAPDASAWSLRPQPPGFDATRTCDSVTVDLDRCHVLHCAVDPRPLHGLLIAADALGAVQRSLERAVAYSGQRRAFGHVLGGFQAVQHRLVDHSVQVRGMSLAVDEASRLLQEGSPDAQRAVTIAEIGVSAQAVHVLHDLIQLTGGIGFTWEYGLHRYERRAHADAMLCANPRRAVRALVDAQGWSR